MTVKEVHKNYDISIPNIYKKISVGKLNTESREGVYEIILDETFFQQFDCSTSDEWITVNEIQKIYPVSRQAIQQWKKKLLFRKERKKLYFNRNEVNRYLETHIYPVGV